MILYDETKITKKEHAEIMAYFKKHIDQPKDGYRVMYADSQVSKNPDNIGIMDKPPTIMLPLIFEHTGEDGVGRMARWCQSLKEGKNGEPNRYLPATYNVSDHVREDNEELLAFMFYFSPLIENGRLHQKNPSLRPSVKIEQKAKEAKKSIASKAMNAKFNMALYGGQLSDERIMILASSYGVYDKNDEFIREIVVQELERVVILGKKIEQFLSEVDGDILNENVAERHIINSAIAAKILFKLETTWYVRTGDKEGESKELVKNTDGESMDELIIYLTKTNRPMLDFIENLLNKRSVSNPE